METSKDNNQAEQAIFPCKNCGTIFPNGIEFERNKKCNCGCSCTKSEEHFWIVLRNYVGGVYNWNRVSDYSLNDLIECVRAKIIEMAPHEEGGE